MARVNWINDDDAPALDEQLQRLAHFTEALADGVIDRDELDQQQARLTAAMKDVEGELSDELHAKVTRLLVELTAYNVMETLHQLAESRAAHVFDEAGAAAP